MSGSLLLLATFSKAVCPCLLPKAERQWLAQGYHSGFCAWGKTTTQLVQWIKLAFYFVPYPLKSCSVKTKVCTQSHNTPTHTDLFRMQKCHIMPKYKGHTALARWPSFLESGHFKNRIYLCCFVGYAPWAPFTKLLQVLLCNSKDMILGEQVRTHKGRDGTHCPLWKKGKEAHG